jgi:hypothetical protein
MPLAASFECARFWMTYPDAATKDPEVWIVMPAMSCDDISGGFA